MCAWAGSSYYSRIWLAEGAKMQAILLIHNLRNARFIMAAFASERGCKGLRYVKK
jgi:hypothetical protein